MNVNPKSLLDPRFPEAKGMSRKQLNELAEPFRYNTLIEMINGLAGEGGLWQRKQRQQHRNEELTNGQISGATRPRPPIFQPD